MTESSTPSSEGQKSSSVPSVERSCNTKLKDYGITKADLEQENFDLIAKVLELLNTHSLWEPDGTYSFSDGERWAKLETGEDDVADNEVR